MTLERVERTASDSGRAAEGAFVRKLSSLAALSHAEFSCARAGERVFPNDACA